MLRISKQTLFSSQGQLYLQSRVVQNDYTVRMHHRLAWKSMDAWWEGLDNDMQAYVEDFDYIYSRDLIREGVLPGLER